MHARIDEVPQLPELSGKRAWQQLLNMTIEKRAVSDLVTLFTRARSDEAAKAIVAITNRAELHDALIEAVVDYR